MSKGVLGPWHAAPVVRTPTNKGGAKRWATAALCRVDGGGAYGDSAVAAGGLRVMACACESGARVVVLEEDNARLRRDVAN